MDRLGATQPRMPRPPIPLAHRLPPNHNALMERGVSDLKRAAETLGVIVVAPFSLVRDGTTITFTAFIAQYGHRIGMVTDPNWNVIAPHANWLIENGYGYSCVDFTGYGVKNLIHVLADWSWSGLPEARPAWLPDEPTSDDTE
jgi:hypothetical protein